MKKIIGAALLGTMAAGVFAADAKISLGFRSRLTAFAHDKVDDGTKKTTNTSWMDWDGKNTAYNGVGTETFKFVMNGDNAGVTLALDLTDSEPQGDAFFTLNEWSGWMQFPIGPGALRLTTGNWKNGYSTGAYRVNTDAGSMEGLDFERYKPGTIFANMDTLAFVIDLTSGSVKKQYAASNAALSGFADYGFNVTDDISLNFLVGGVSRKEYKNGSEIVRHVFDITKNGDDTTYWKSAFVSRVQFGMKNVLNAEFIYKLSHNDNDYATNTFALYVMPQIMKELALSVGGAIELKGDGADNSVTDKNEGYTDWTVDLRLRYQVMDPLSITFFTNVSGTDTDGRNISSGLAGAGAIEKKAGASGYIGGGFSKPDVKIAMWNQLGFKYVINDMLTAGLNVGLITPLEKGEKSKDNKYNPEWRVTPAIQIFADKKASLWTGVSLSGASATIGDKDVSVFSVAIPAIFRVQM